MDAVEMNMAAITALLKCMANSQRLFILCALARREQTVKELVYATGLTQPAVSKHLMLLRRGGIVATRRDRQAICYSVADNVCKALLICLNQEYSGNESCKTS